MRKEKEYLVIFLVLLVGLFATYKVSEQQKANHHKKILSDFNLENEKRSILLEKELENKQDILDSFVRFFAASNDISSGEFHTFGQNLISKYQLLSICWTDNIKNEFYQININPSFNLCTQVSSEVGAQFLTNEKVFIFSNSVLSRGGQQGVVSVIFEMSTLSKYFSSNNSLVYLRLVEKNQDMLFQYLSEDKKFKKIASPPKDSFTFQKPVLIGPDLELLIQANENLHGIKGLERTKSEIALLASVFVFTILMAFYILLILKRKKKIEKAVSKRTQELNLEVEKKEQAIEQIEFFAKKKSEFLAIMSHEIRTPMNGILGVLDLFNVDNLNKEQLDDIEVMKSSGNDLLRILNDILDVSKLDSKSIKLQDDRFSWAELLPHCLSLFKKLSKEKDIIIQYDCSSITSGHIGDSRRIKQIITNLVNNALKFTEKGTIEVFVNTKAVDEKEDLVEISVIDTGVGVPEDKLHQLFSPFSQVDSSLSRSNTGVGLGLHICSRLVQLMNGSINFESELGTGTKVTVFLSLERCDLDLTSPTLENLLIKNFSGIKVLVAEDNEVNQLIIKRMLKKLDIDPVIVETGLEAVNECSVNSYDLVFMDMHMPQMDGVEATKKILENNDKKSAPSIVALTANILEEDKKKCLEAGMTDFISKPMKLNDLKKVLTNLT